MERLVHFLLITRKVVCKGEYESEFEHLGRLEGKRTYLYPRLIVSACTLIAEGSKRKPDKDQRCRSKDKPQFYEFPIVDK